ncbi:MAG: ATP-binding protein [Prevotellaceae bacterium]|jgi:DNA transposition AAA+ family ATPase|nr:ATP-binding protein [Prevotellaceae bacterium]
MKFETKQQIVEALEQYMQAHGISQNEAAKRSGVNASYLIEMRKGNYSIIVGGKEVEIADKHFEKIAEMVGFEIRKTYWETRPTDQLVEIMSELEDAKRYGYTRTIIGDTGCGKSYAIELFQKKNPNDTFVITVSQLDNIGDILDKIIDLLKIVPSKTKSKKMKDIVLKLRNIQLDGGQPMLIFDEAEYMKQITLCAIKELFDNLNKYCAIVLVGHYQLICNLDKLRKKSKDGIPQLYRRIKFGIRRLAAIDRSYTQFLAGIEDRKLRKFLQGECENYGELHDVLVPALREAERSGEPISEDFVRRLLNMPKRG